VAETPETGSLILDNYESFSYYNSPKIDTSNVPLEGNKVMNNYNSVMIPNDISKFPRGNSFDEEKPSVLRQS